MTDSIPFEKFLEMGYDRLVVVLTKPAGYVKQAIPAALARLYYAKKYPEFAKRVAQRHVMYNQTMKRLEYLEKQGHLIVFRPSQIVPISRTEKNPDKLQALYDVGVRDARERMEQVREYLKSEIVL